MDSRSAAEVVVAVLVILVTASCPVYAGSVYIYSGDFDLSIPAEPGNTKGWMGDAIIEVPDHYVIFDIDVGITLTHTNVFDLKIFLQSPAGRKLCLNMYNLDEFFVGQNYTQTIFDDEAKVPIENAQPPFAGRFRPRAPNLLEIFDGKDAHGSWRLQVYDAYGWDTGTLNSFELMITTPEPTTATLLILGAGLICILRKRC